MALVLKDRIKETTTTTGSASDYSLGGAFSGFEAFSEIGDTNETYYACTDGTDWEIGRGTYSSSGNTLSRTAIATSNSDNSKINWGIGTKTIFVTQPADKAVFLNADGDIEFDNTHRIKITSNNSEPVIDIGGSGPNFIKFRGASFSDAANSVNLIYRTNPNDLLIETHGSQKIAEFGGDDGHAKLYYNNADRLETTSDGIDITGHLELGDNQEIRLGNDDDLKLYHDSQDSYIEDAGTGNLNIKSNYTNIFGAGGTAATFYPGNAVTLYYNNVGTFSTAADGVTVQATGENSARLTLQSDDASPTDWDYEGIIDFKADDDGGTPVNYARISGRVQDASAGTFDSYLYLHTMENNGLAETMFLTSGGQLGLNKPAPRFTFWQPVLSGGSRSSFSMDLMPPTDLRADRDIRFPDGSGTLMLNRGDGELNNTVQNFQQDFSSGSYFTAGEYIEIASISPTGNSRNYSISGKIMAQASNNTQILDINVGIRFNSSGSFGATILYNSSQMNTDWVEPVLWTNTSTDNVKLVIQAKTSSIHNLGVDLTFIQRSGYNDITWNTTEVQTDTTTVPTGYTEYIGEKAIGSVANGAVELYHNNVKKLETTSAGVDITGELTPSSHINLADDSQVKLGDDEDFIIQHSGTASIIRDTAATQARPLYLQSNETTNGVIITKVNAAETMAKFIPDGACELYHNDSLKFNTTTLGTKSTGIHVVQHASGFGAVEVGGPSGGHIDLKAPNSDDYDFRIIHTGSSGESAIIADDLHFKSATGEESYIDAAVNGAVNLYYDNSKKFETTATGVTVTGLLSATTKSFDIPHPTKDGMRLRYGSLEGPENGVYVRGRLTGSSVIELPEHWSGLVDEDSITVQLTAIGSKQDLWVEEVSIEQVKVCDANTDCFYMVMAERIDVAKLEVEYAN